MTCIQCGVPSETRQCKPCKAAYMREWNAKNPDKVKKSAKKKYEKSKEYYAEKSKEWVLNNRKRSQEIKKAYKQRNREQYLAQQREYAKGRYVENREELLARRQSPEALKVMAEWREKNRERLNAVYLAAYHANPDKQKKHKARNVLNKALKAAQVLRPLNCMICDKTGRIEGHHEDYDKPLEVIWLCRNCHGKLHSKYSKVSLENQGGAV